MNKTREYKKLPDKQAQEFKELCKKVKLKQCIIAKRIGFGRTTVNKWFNKGGMPFFMNEVLELEKLKLEIKELNAKRNN